MRNAFREPRLVERGRWETVEHGLGAELSIGRRFRVRPSKRKRGSASCKTRWYRVGFVALEVFSRAAFHFIGGFYHVRKV